MRLRLPEELQEQVFVFIKNGDPFMTDDKAAQKAVEQTKADKKADTDKPSAGPHARKDLTDHAKTPGTGSLPDERASDVDAGSE